MRHSQFLGDRYVVFRNVYAHANSEGADTKVPPLYHLTVAKENLDKIAETYNFKKTYEEKMLLPEEEVTPAQLDISQVSSDLHRFYAQTHEKNRNNAESMEHRMASQDDLRFIIKYGRDNDHLQQCALDFLENGMNLISLYNVLDLPNGTKLQNCLEIVDKLIAYKRFDIEKLDSNQDLQRVCNIGIELSGERRNAYYKQRFQNALTYLKKYKEKATETEEKIINYLGEEDSKPLEPQYQEYLNNPDNLVRLIKICCRNGQPLISLDGIDLDMEDTQNKKTFQELSDNLKQLDRPNKDFTTINKSIQSNLRSLLSDGKELVINDMVITNNVLGNLICKPSVEGETQEFNNMNQNQLRNQSVSWRPTRQNILPLKQLIKYPNILEHPLIIDDSFDILTLLFKEYAFEIDSDNTFFTFIKDAIRNENDLLKLVSICFENDNDNDKAKEYLKELIVENPSILRTVHFTDRRSRELYPLIFKDIFNKDVMKELVKQNCDILLFLPHNLQLDKSILDDAIHVKNFTSEDLKSRYTPNLQGLQQIEQDFSSRKQPKKRSMFSCFFPATQVVSNFEPILQAAREQCKEKLQNKIQHLVQKKKANGISMFGGNISDRYNKLCEEYYQKQNIYAGLKLVEYHINKIRPQNLKDIIKIHNDIKGKAVLIGDPELNNYSNFIFQPTLSLCSPLTKKPDKVGIILMDSDGRICIRKSGPAWRLCSTELVLSSDEESRQISAVESVEEQTGYIVQKLEQHLGDYTVNGKVARWYSAKDYNYNQIGWKGLTGWDSDGTKMSDQTERTLFVPPNQALQYLLDEQDKQVVLGLISKEVSAAERF